MSIAERLLELRKKNGKSQEEVGDLLAVSRQAVSKWESGTALPDTDNIVRLAELYGVTTDYLLTGKVTIEAESGPAHNADAVQGGQMLVINPWARYEYKSKRRLWGLPLVHINIGVGAYRAKGIIAIGTIATGIVSIGLLSLGVIAIGLLALGLLALATLGIGLAAGGAIAVGLLAAGALSVGFVSFGAVAVGQFAVGAAAFGRWFAYGDHARGIIAVGKTFAGGTHSFVGGYDKAEVSGLLNEVVPKFWQWLASWMKAII